MRRLRKILFLLSAIFLFLPFFSFASNGAERIESFAAEYNLNQNGSVEVAETIDYNFGPSYKHGIYRYIPYETKLTNGETHYLNISSIKVVDETGNSYRFETIRSNGNIEVKIGDKNKTLSGKKIYKVSYLIKGGLKYLDSGDEFHWNVTGNGWSVPIENTTARVVTYKEISESRVDCNIGAYGSNKKCLSAVKTKNGAFYSQGLLGGGEGLTIVYGVPKGTYAFLTGGVAGSGFSQSGIILLGFAALAIPIAVFIFMLRHFWKWGRDPKGRGVMVVEYEPPKDLTPIEVGTLMDFRVDSKDISAEIIYLATKGYLKIRREAKKNILGSDDYFLTKLKDFKGSGFDLTLMDGIFKSTNKEVRLSDFKNEFYEKVQSIKSNVQSGMVEKGYFKSKVSSAIAKYFSIGTSVIIVGIFFISTLGSISPGAEIILPFFAPALFISGLIIIGFGFFMPARTANGVEAKEKVLGFKKYLTMVDAERIKWSDAPKKDPKKFEEYLPYAMVFGVEKEWAKQFEGMYNTKPSWYEDSAGANFAPIVFVSSMNNFSTSASQNMFSAPASSDSGFGGGGFSGGGFGGGGGGSW